MAQKMKFTITRQNRARLCEMNSKVLHVFELIKREALLTRLCVYESPPDPTPYLSDEILKQILLNATDPQGNSALHFVGTVRTVKALLDDQPPTIKEKLICKCNEKGQTILHAAAERGDNHTAKHFCIASDFEVYLDHLLKPDMDGNTPLHVAAKRRNWGSVEAILDSLEGNQTRIKFVLTHRNKDNHNLFHLGAMNDGNIDHGIIWQHRDVIDLEEDMIKCDKEGNQMVHHLVLTQKLSFLADFVMNLPLHRRRHLLLLVTSKPGLRCIDFMYGWQRCDRAKILSLFRYGYQSAAEYGVNFQGGEASNGPLGMVTYDLSTQSKIMRMVNYALYSFSLTDLASTALLTSTGDLPKCTWCYFDDDGLTTATGPMSPGAFLSQKMISIDTPGKHGEPKVVVRRKRKTGDNCIKILPPGPDFLIITAVYYGTEKAFSKWPCDGMPQTDIRAVLDFLRIKDEIESVHVNSTLGKHEVCSYEHLIKDPVLESDHVLISGRNRGKALLICNQKDRDGYQHQYEDAKLVLREYLQLDITEKHDLTAEEILAETESFAKSPDHGQMAVLVIQAHGDTRGSISGVDKKRCLVQNIIDALCSNLPAIPKVVLLSFCRGILKTKFDRSCASFESSILPDMLGGYNFPRIKQTWPDDVRRKTYRRVLKHPEAELPPDCYVLYSTLPDSKSPQEYNMFEEMRKYLQERVDNTGLVTLYDKTGSTTESASLVSASKPEWLEQNKGKPVELTAMFTDVSALTREKSPRSGFAIYPNLCYTVNKHSKHVVIDLHH